MYWSEKPQFRFSPGLNLFLPDPRSCRSIVGAISKLTMPRDGRSRHPGQLPSKQRVGGSSPSRRALLSLSTHLPLTSPPSGAILRNALLFASFGPRGGRPNRPCPGKGLLHHLGTKKLPFSSMPKPLTDQAWILNPKEVVQCPFAGHRLS